VSFVYTIQLKSRQKHTYIRIRDGVVTLSAPANADIGSLHQLIDSKASWIAKSIKSTYLHDLSMPDARVYLLGQSYGIDTHLSDHYELKWGDERVKFVMAERPTHDIMLQMLQHHYKQQAPAIITPRVKYWAEQMQLYPSKLSYRHAKSRWGSCSTRNNISLSTYLMMTPIELIDYVIVHELSHITHKNHSREFWSLVQRHIPDWQSKRKKLKTYSKYI